VKITIDVPDYAPETGLRMTWESGSVISTELQHGVLHLIANEEGLISLARLFLTLTHPDVPSGNHWHLDDSNSLEEGSFGMIIERA
jgi:hypothetical protein